MKKEGTQPSREPGTSLSELEGFIDCWHHDEASHNFSRLMGAYFLELLESLRQQGASERVLRAHRQNLWYIGKFTCDYGDTTCFSPEKVSYGYKNECVFRRKVSESNSAMQSYLRTWKVLQRYTRHRVI